MRVDIVFRVHALQRMFERGINDADVRQVVTTGEVVERYEDDFPYPSRLMLGFAGGQPIHVVVAEDVAQNRLIVITVYEPDPQRWDTTFRLRKRP